MKKLFIALMSGMLISTGLFGMEEREADLQRGAAEVSVSDSVVFYEGWGLFPDGKLVYNVDGTHIIAYEKKDGVWFLNSIPMTSPETVKFLDGIDSSLKLAVSNRQAAVRRVLGACGAGLLAVAATNPVALGCLGAIAFNAALVGGVVYAANKVCPEKTAETKRRLVSSASRVKSFVEDKLSQASAKKRKPSDQDDAK